MASLSLLRSLEHECLSSLELTGAVLDLGGSKKSGYHEVIKGEHSFTVVNYGEMHPGMDMNFNIEERFPLDDESYDNVISMNVLEHIFNYHNVFAETARVLKNGGLFVSTVPFMHHIHGSPDDYHRYTESTFRKLADKYGFEVVEIKVLGYGLFSLIYQCVGGWVPTNIGKNLFKGVCVGIDKLLLNLKKYQDLKNRIPLGYYWILKKK
jgi:SAM-dependent methyltransferase